MNMVGLASMHEGRITHGLLERMRAMEADMASLREELRSDGDSQRGMNRVF